MEHIEREIMLIGIFDLCLAATEKTEDLET